MRSIRKWWFTSCVVLLFATVAWYIWDTGHQAALSTQCHSRIFEVASAIQMYKLQHGSLPPRVVYVDGVPMHSWRVLILQYIDRQLFNQYRFNEPWDSKHNMALASQRPSCFACPNTAAIEPFHTSYLAITSSQLVIVDKAHAQSATNATGFSLIAETRRTDIHWMAPVDIAIDDLSPEIDDFIGGNHLNGGKAATVTGRVVSIGDLPPATLI